MDYPKLVDGTSSPTAVDCAPANPTAPDRALSAHYAAIGKGLESLRRPSCLQIVGDKQQSMAQPGDDTSVVSCPIAPNDTDGQRGQGPMLLASPHCELLQHDSSQDKTERALDRSRIEDFVGSVNRMRDGRDITAASTSYHDLQMQGRRKPGEAAGDTAHTGDHERVMDSSRSGFGRPASLVCLQHRPSSQGGGGVVSHRQIGWAVESRDSGTPPKRDVSAALAPRVCVAEANRYDKLDGRDIGGTSAHIEQHPECDIMSNAGKTGSVPVSGTSRSATAGVATMATQVAAYQIFASARGEISEKSDCETFEEPTQPQGGSKVATNGAFTRFECSGSQTPSRVDRPLGALDQQRPDETLPPAAHARAAFVGPHEAHMDDDFQMNDIQRRERESESTSAKVRRSQHCVLTAPISISGVICGDKILRQGHATKPNITNTNNVPAERTLSPSKTTTTAHEDQDGRTASVAVGASDENIEHITRQSLAKEVTDRSELPEAPAQEAGFDELARDGPKVACVTTMALDEAKPFVVGAIHQNHPTEMSLKMAPKIGEICPSMPANTDNKGKMGTKDKLVALQATSTGASSANCKSPPALASASTTPAVIPFVQGEQQAGNPHDAPQSASYAVIGGDTTAVVETDDEKEEGGHTKGAAVVQHGPTPLEELEAKLDLLVTDRVSGAADTNGVFCDMPPFVSGALMVVFPKGVVEGLDNNPGAEGNNMQEWDGSGGGDDERIGRDRNVSECAEGAVAADDNISGGPGTAMVLIGAVGGGKSTVESTDTSHSTDIVVCTEKAGKWEDISRSGQNDDPAVVSASGVAAGVDVPIRTKDSTAGATAAGGASLSYVPSHQIGVEVCQQQRAAESAGVVGAGNKAGPHWNEHSSCVGSGRAEGWGSGREKQQPHGLSTTTTTPTTTMEMPEEHARSRCETERARPKCICFQDSLGRKYVWPWRVAKTWAGAKSLITSAYAPFPDLRDHVAAEHFDLIAIQAWKTRPQSPQDTFRKLGEPGYVALSSGGLKKQKKILAVGSDGSTNAAWAQPPHIGTNIDHSSGLQSPVNSGSDANGSESGSSFSEVASSLGSDSLVDEGDFPQLTSLSHANIPLPGLRPRPPSYPSYPGVGDVSPHAFILPEVWEDVVVPGMTIKLLLRLWQPLQPSEIATLHASGELPAASSLQPAEVGVDEIYAQRPTYPPVTGMYPPGRYGWGPSPLGRPYGMPPPHPRFLNHGMRPIGTALPPGVLPMGGVRYVSPSSDDDPGPRPNTRKKVSGTTRVRRRRGAR